MIIRNRTFFIAENVSAARRHQLTREILLRGGIVCAEPDEKTDYEIFDAENEYLRNRKRPADTKALRITVNEMTAMLDSAEAPAQSEYLVVKGVLQRWLPEESDRTVLKIPEGVRRISAKAFHALYHDQESVYRKRRKMITRIVFPKTLEVIEQDAFRDFRSLCTVSFQNGLMSLNGFRSCVKLNGVSIPKSCTEIGEYAFYGCVSLRDVKFSEEITMIGSHAFHRSGIESLLTWEKLSRIGTYAFANCSNLNTVSFESSQLVCEKKAFHECNALNSVIVNEGSVSIEVSTFSALTMEKCLRKLEKDGSGTASEKMWKDMMTAGPAAFSRRLEREELNDLRPFCRQISGLPLKGRDDDIADPAKREALKRIRILQKEIGLNPKVQKYYRADRLYYSYFTAGGLIGSIDTISYDPAYEKIVRETERLYGIRVYHVIESYVPWKSLILLYVEHDPADWEYGRPDHGWVSAYVHNFELGEGEFGDIRVSSYDGALYRIG